MIHLALEVLAFLFLCWVGLIVLGIVAAAFEAIFGTSSKTSLTPHRLPSSKSPFALGHRQGHNSFDPDHDPRSCPLCLGGGHPSTVRENQQERERQIEAPQQEAEYQHIPGFAWGDPSSYVRVSTPEELERAREAFANREAQRREAEAVREREAVLEQEHKNRDDEKREQEAREFLIREAAAVLKEREEREAAQKRKREAEANRTRWIH
jgi:hypothetical protein